LTEERHVTIDLDDPGVLLRADVIADPTEFYDRLRREAPVWQVPGQDTFLVSDPALIREAVGRPADFSSNLVSLLHDDGQGGPVAYPIAPYRDPIHVLSTADPPLHTRHRKFLQPHLNPAAVAALEPTVAAIVDELLDGLAGRPHVDIVPGFTEVLPMRTICAFIGLPAEDAPRLIDLVARTGALLDGVTLRDGMGAAASSAFELAIYVDEAAKRSLAQPADERTGLLAVFASGVETGMMNAGEVRDILMVLVTAGSDTTASLLATAVEMLARDAELQSRLRNDPSGIPNAIEEMLRVDGPFQFHYRYTPAATTLGGVAIPAESLVLLMWAAANRPAPVVGTDGGGPDADSDGGGPAAHFAFGKGLHFCIGAPVARLEARVALARLLGRTRRIELSEDHPPTQRPSVFIRRHAGLHVDIAWA
jgi:cytochrome P450